MFEFFAIPIFALLVFALSLHSYVSAKNKNKTEPGTFSDEELKKRKTTMIVSAVVAGVLVAIVMGLMGLLVIAVANM